VMSTVEVRWRRRTDSIGTAVPIKAGGTVRWVGAWCRRAQRPPTGEPGWKGLYDRWGCSQIISNRI
jgi:hypothetical protein